MAGETVAGDLYESVTGQLFEIDRQLRQLGGYPFNPHVLKGHLQAAIEGRFGGDVSQTSVPPPAVSSTGATISLPWSNVYEKIGLKDDFERFLTEGRNAETMARQDVWSIPVLKGVISNMVVKTLRDLEVNVCLCTDDIDKAISQNDRDPNYGSYTICFKKNIEADPENANQSADDRRGLKDITLDLCTLNTLATKHAWWRFYSSCATFLKGLLRE